MVCVSAMVMQMNAFTVQAKNVRLVNVKRTPVVYHVPNAVQDLISINGNLLLKEAKAVKVS